jgi:hypothetical protein
VWYALLYRIAYVCRKPRPFDVEGIHRNVGHDAQAMKIARHRVMKNAIVAPVRRLAVIMHRIWVDGTGFRWTREVAAA